ncbi:MAG: hypothetical protein N5P05_000405 [Chroococcopsis gigantea SAG 12.99]|nr:hypothetical protein [Chroococcopsis gigantea SAG 12.99]
MGGGGGFGAGWGEGGATWPSNIAYSYGGGGAGLGGAIFIRSGGLNLNNVSFSNNNATGGTSSGVPGQGIGGAIFAVSPALASAAGVSTAPLINYNGVSFNNNTSGNSAPNTYGVFIVNPDTAIVTEAVNDVPGVNITGNIFANDTDTNNTTAGLSVVSVRTGNVEGQGTPGSLGTGIIGTYGTFILNSDGSYTYILDNNDPAVQALNPGDSVTDSLNYTIRNASDGSTDTTTLTVTINGTNDKPTLAPVDPLTFIDTAAYDTFSPISGNLTGFDVDGGPTALMYGIAGGTVAGGLSTLNGKYGFLSLNTSTGAYTYTPNNAAINGLGANAFDQEDFNFTISDGDLSRNFSGAVQLTDNFFIDVNNPNFNPDRRYDPNYNLGNRQSGPLALTGWVGAGFREIMIAGQLIIYTWGTTATTAAALDRNFNDTVSAGNLQIDFDLSPQAEIGYRRTTSDWGSIALGRSTADKSAPCNSTAPGFAILFRRNGGIQAFDGGQDVTGQFANNNWGGQATDYTFYHFTLQLSDPTDDNPFNGIGQTNIDVYAGNNLVYRYIKGNGGYRDNYLNFSSNYLSHVDNLAISKPNTIVSRQYIQPLTVNVQGANDAPGDLTLTPGSINENVPTSATVGVLSTIDADNTSGFTYSLVDGEGSADNASFTLNGNILRINLSPDFETKSVYNIRVKTTDAGGLSLEKTLSVFINDVNETPTNITLSPDRVDENVSIGTVVGNFTTSDPDAGDTFTYTLIGGTGSDDNSAFTLDGGVLKVNAPLNFEAKSLYTIRVRTTDRGGLFFDKALTVNINDVNESPVDITLSRDNINENVSPNSFIGNLIASDPDVGNIFAYNLVTGTGSDDNGSFTISNGGLYINNSPDFESKSVYSIRVRTTDQNGLSFEKSFNIRINDVNESPTDLSLSNNNIDENSPANTIVGTLATTDPDINDSSTYSIVSGNDSVILLSDNFSASDPGNTYNLNYNLAARQGGSLVATNPIQWRANGNTQVGNNTGGIDSGKYLLTAFNGTAALDYNFNNAVSQGGLQIRFGLASNSTGNSDTSVWGGISIGLSADDKNKFINWDTPHFGILFRSNGDVQAFDGSNIVTGSPKNWGGTSNDGTLYPFTLNLSDPTDNNPFDGVGQTNIDVYSGTTLIYSYIKGNGGYGDNYINFVGDYIAGIDNLVITKLPLFGINGNNLIVNRPPDYESQSSYNLKLRTTDQGGLFFDKDITVNINDVNEAPTNINISNNTIDENLPLNTTVGNFTTTDQDSGNSFIYSLVAGTGADDNDSFVVNNNQLIIKGSANFESKSLYKIRVKTTDQGGLSFEKALSINIKNINEAPTNLTLSVNRINENIPANTVIGNFSSIDPDSGDTFAYSLVDGIGSTDNSTFSISGSGLKINSSPDFETQPAYSIRVKTTDAGGLSFEKVLTIDVNDLNEAPTDLVLSNANIDENVAINSLVGYLLGTDKDANDTLTYALVAGVGATDNSVFSIVNGNQLTINTSPDFETRSSYSIRVRTTDKAGLFLDKNLIITVNNVNEAATNIVLSPGNVNENVPANTIISSLSSTGGDATDIYSYSLVTGPGSDDNSAFTITNGNGLQLKSSPDFETKSTYNIRVRTTDQTGQSFEKALVFKINDLNETPLDINLSPNSINENIPAYTVIGSLNTIDQDSNNTFTYSIVSGGGPVNLLSDNFDTTAINYAIGYVNDYIAQTQSGSFAPTNWVTAGNGVLLSSPADDLLSGYYLYTVFGSTAAIDRNFNNANSQGGLEVSFSLSPNFRGSALGNDDSSVWGAISLGLADSDKNLSINDPAPHFGILFRGNGGIQAFDGHSDISGSYNTWGGTGNDATLYPFTVRLTDPTDNNPFDGVGQTNIDVYADKTLIYQYVKGNGGYSQNYLNFSGSSVAAFDNITINKLGLFSINGDKLTVNKSLDFEAQSSYNIKVRTTDQGGLFLDKDITINVNNVNESPTGLSLSASEISKFIPANTNIGNFGTTDPDANNTFTYSLVTGAGSDDNSAFGINGNELKINISPGTDTRANYKIRVRSTDQGGLFFENTFIINVNDLKGLLVTGTVGNDNLIGTIGNDTLQGLGGNDTLSGLEGDDILDGGMGNDSMAGGAGNDFYTVDSRADKITELPDGGVDTVGASVGYTLTSNVENLELTGAASITGTGNNLNNLITGNSGNNYLDGKGGNDTLIGGPGNDTYILDAQGDVVTENVNAGKDTVRTGSSYTLGDNLENLVLLGTGDFNGMGNNFNNILTGNSGKNLLQGFEGNDSLDGKAGDDTLVGGTGNDTYTIDAGDTITENANEGIDTVKVNFASYTLSSNLENLTLLGNVAIDGTGNSNNNLIKGNSAANTLTGLAGDDTLVGGNGNDTLVGGNGKDTLTGNAGSDQFVLNAPGSGVDYISDFNVSDDAFVVYASEFGAGLTIGSFINANQFYGGAGATKAKTVDHRFIYNSTNGALFFDPDGTGAIRPGQIATLSSQLPLSNNNFLVSA